MKINSHCLSRPVFSHMSHRGIFDVNLAGVSKHDEHMVAACWELRNPAKMRDSLLLSLFAKRLAIAVRSEEWHGILIWTRLPVDLISTDETLS